MSENNLSTTSSMKVYRQICEEKRWYKNEMIA